MALMKDMLFDLVMIIFFTLLLSFLTFSLILDPKMVIKERIAADPNNQYTTPIMEKEIKPPSIVMGGLIAV